MSIKKTTTPEALRHNINYFSQLKAAIKKGQQSYFVESGDVVGEQQALPIKKAILSFKNSGQLSLSQYSELTALYELSNKTSDAPSKKLDVSTLRLETFEDLRRVIESSHKKTLPIGNTYVETPELIYWAKFEQKISTNEAKKLLRLYIKKLFDHKGGNLKKEVISGLSFACNQGVLESIEELIFILEVISDNSLRLEILEKINTSNIGKFTHPAEDWVNISSNSEQGELETSLQEIEDMTKGVFEGHRVFSEQTKTLKEDIDRLKARESKQDEEILTLRINTDEKDKKIRRLEDQKREAEDSYVAALSGIGDVLDEEKAKTEYLSSTIQDLKALQEESRKANRAILQELNEKLSQLEATTSQQKKTSEALKKGKQELASALKSLLRDEKVRKATDAKTIEDLEAINKKQLTSIEESLQKTEALEKEAEALEKTLETLKTEKIALEFCIEKSLKESNSEKARQEEEISTLKTIQETQKEQIEKLTAEKTNKDLETEALKTRNSELEKSIKSLQVEIAKTTIQTNRIKHMLNKSKEAMLQPNTQ